MASSSILSRPFSTTRDVFLSFRGRDSRKIIVDPLCTALYFEGIDAFFNDRELEGEGMSLEGIHTFFRKRAGPVSILHQPGSPKNRHDPVLPPFDHFYSQLLPVVEGLSLQLLPAAKMSKISIVVLSESYASSGWCLDELVELMNMEKQQHVIPIFYHVDPADVVHQTGGFGTAFRKHTDMIKADTWKTTLTKIGRFPGYHLPNAQKWLEPELISVIVRNVSGLLCGNDSFGSDINVTELNEVGALASCDTGSDVLCHEESLETDPNRICQVTGAPNVVTGSENMPEISRWQYPRWQVTGLPNFRRRNVVPARMGELREARLRSIFDKNSKSRKKSGKAVVSMNTISTASQADEMEVQVDFQGSYYDLFDVEEFLRLLKKDLEYNALVSKHVLVRNLKVMDIQVSKLSEIPNNLRFPDLEKLFLYTNFRLRKIPESFFEQRPPVNYTKLNLKHLPPLVFEQMPALKELNFSYLPMRILPPPVSDIILPPLDINLSTLTELVMMESYFKLTRIPHIISALDNLTALDLTRCPLIEFPESFDFPRSLSSLNLTKCESLTKLPLSIGKLRFLKYIHLSGCSSLFESRCGKLPIKRLSWNKQAEEKKVELDFHETKGTPSDITEILGLMEKILQHPFLKSKAVAVIKLKVIHMSSSKVPEIPKNLSFPDLEKLVLHPDFDFSSITSSFFKSFPAFPVLDMSHSSIKTLPSWVYELTDLKGLILQRCELLIELPDGIGALENLELLDLEGTHLVCLPDELGKLINLMCLKVSLYYDDSYMKSRKILDIIPTALLSKLTKLEELSIKFDPQDVWCNALVKAIIADLLSLRKLKTLKLYLPTIELLQNLMELKSNEDDMSIYQNLSNFSVIIGPHGQRFISRLPCDLEEEYLKLKKCLKYIAGKDNTSEFFAEALKHANALYLDRHWNIQKLSIFKADKLNKLKFCMLVDCNEMQTVFDASDFNHEDNILSLQYLAIHYLRNLEVIWKGPHVVCCLQYLKVLVLHMCPNLTTIFTPVLLGVLVNLKEITVEDCAKITSLVSGDSTQLTGTEHLLRLKKLSLLYLPELESISSGISIGPKLENVVIYDCPKLKILPSLGVHNEKVIKIKGEGEWWNALEWSDGQPQYIHNAFSELDIEGAFLDELGTQYVNSLRLFVEECNAN